ncbi:heme A synthase, partial [Mastigocladus laminosus WC112]
GLLILQLIVGFATFRLHLQVEPLTVSHQAIGATLLGILVVFTVLCLRDWVANLSINAESNTETANPIPN